jgi:hypothetical protein
MKTTALAVSAATLTVLAFVPALAQQATGVPGSPPATSKPYWPPKIVPPKGAPNILLIMTDDQG